MRRNGRSLCSKQNANITHLQVNNVGINSKELTRNEGDNGRFKKRYELIRSARERQRKVQNQAQTCLNIAKINESLGTKSKFLEKFEKIKSGRIREDSREEERGKDQFESNKKIMYVQKKLSNMSTQKSIISSMNRQSSELEMGPIQMKLIKKGRLNTPPQLKISRPVSRRIQRLNLASFKQRDFILKNNGQQNQLSKTNLKESQGKGEMNQFNNFLTGYWIKQNKFVSLIPLEFNENLVFNHPNILPVYGEVTINKTKYIICDQYKDCSLKNLLSQFGPFNQQLARKYLLQIARGLQHIHNNKIAHHRLNIKTILYNQDGGLFINIIKLTSKPLNEKEKNPNLHYFSPEIILEKHSCKLPRSDIWALGCIAILLMSTTGLRKSPYHPYNPIFWQSGKPNQDKAIYQNLKLIYPDYFAAVKAESLEGQCLYRTANAQGIGHLSKSAISFLRCCLSLKSDKRWSVEALLEHQFLREP